MKKAKISLTLLVVLTLFLWSLTAAERSANRARENAVAVAVVATAGIDWTPSRDYEGADLVVSGPEGEIFRGTFEAGLPLFYDFLDMEGNPLRDGTYKYELVFRPAISDALRQEMRLARESGDESIIARLREEGLLPRERMVLNGSFTLKDGLAVDPDVPEDRFRSEAGLGDDPDSGAATPQDVVVNDDKIILGSLCVGFDCVNGESFGFDTIRMKENNTRMQFLDTSNSASFPDNDWRIVANDSSNGGAEYLAFEDSSAGRQPFRVEAGARSNALYVESDGDVGIGTANPAVSLEIVDGNTPTVRLTQDGSSGFSPQTWDLAGNETNFFIRDATNGSKLPFRIRPNAPTSSIDIEGSTGDVGFGTASPEAPIHVRDSEAGHGASILIDEANSGDNTGFTIRSASAAQDWVFEVNSVGTFQINSLAVAGGPELTVRESDGRVQVRNNMDVVGTLSKGAGSFKIDHPMDPENKFLLHSFVESPDMLNIYNGMAQLDDEGQATVALPDWFDALNIDFRYQLTAIGVPSPNLFVAEEVKDNKFKIAGGVPGSKVSWQVTGIRNDPYAQENRIKTEEPKPDYQRGFYLHPAAYGQPLTRGLNWASPSRKAEGQAQPEKKQPAPRH